MSEPDRKEPSFDLPARSGGQPLLLGEAELASPEGDRDLRAREPRLVDDGPAVKRRRWSPGRFLLWLLPTLLLLFLLYGLLAKVDRVVTAAGSVVPSGEVEVIAHPAGGAVATIHAREGDLVSAGMALVEIDPTAAEQDAARLQFELDYLDAEALRLEAEATGSEVLFPAELQERRPEALRAQVELFETRQGRLEARRAAAREAIAQHAGAVRAREQQLAGLRDRLATLRDQAGAIKLLLDKGYAAATHYQAIQRQVAEAAGELERARAGAAAAEAAEQAAQQALETLERDWQNQVLDELTATLGERERARDALARQEATLRDPVLRAPVDGVIQELAATGAGQALDAGQAIMKIAPVGDGVVVEASLTESDVGRLQPGMPARIRLVGVDPDAYGVLQGTVGRISPEAAPDPDGGAPLYAFEVRSDRTSLQGNGRPLRVLPGMRAEVDLRIGEQSLLSHLFERLRAAGAGGLGEG